MKVATSRVMIRQQYLHCNFVIFLLLHYTRNSFQQQARASDCSLQRAREGTPLYPTYCYARYMMCALSDAM